MPNDYGALFDEPGQHGEYGALFDEPASARAPVAAGPAPKQDVGYEARRHLRALSGPREYTDEDLGIESQPEWGRDPISGGYPGKPRPPGELQRGELAEDPTAQAVVASTVLGPLGRLAMGPATAALGPVAAPVAVAAGEGALASKAMGGEAAEGAKMGGLFGLIPGAAAFGRLMREGNPGAAVPGVGLAQSRTAARLVDDIKRGETRAPARAANGISESKLADVVAELPEVREALMTKARPDPGAAHKTVRATVDGLKKMNDADFTAIQEQHGGVPLTDVTSRLEGIEARLNAEGHGVAADAAGRVRADLEKRYGKEPDVIRRRLGLPDDDVKLTASQLRNIRNDMGDQAFPPGAQIKPNNKRFALAQVYGAYNEAIEAVAANTKGVDVPALKTRNRQMSALIPVEESLAARAAAEPPGLIAGVKRAVRNIPASAMRRAEYRMSELARPGVPPIEAGPPSGAAAAAPAFDKRDALMAEMRALSAAGAQ